MEIDGEEAPVSPSPTLEPVVSLTEDQAPIDPLPIPPIIPPPPVVPLPAQVVPPFAPIPILTPSIPRPLAPIPVPVRPPAASRNGDTESNSDHDEGTAPEYEVSEQSKQAKERQEKAMQEFLMKRRAAALAVPTNDMAVRARLRRLGEPITLFGEREMERRDRLRSLMAKLDNEGHLERLMKAHEDEEAAASATTEEAEEDNVQYPFYTEGSLALRQARLQIAEYALKRADSRLKRARRQRDDPDEDVDAEIDWALNQARGLALDCSEIGDDRPLSGCSFSYDGTILATW